MFDRCARSIGIAAAALLLSCISHVGSVAAPQESLLYRGFTVDLSASRDPGDLETIKSSLRGQIDIVADCGASPAVLAFFRSQKITLSGNGGDGGGRYDAANGVRIDAVLQPRNEPILLHEFLHAYQARVLAGGFHNPDVATFYLHAKQARLYPEDAFLLSNPGEFFAITASLYLYGHVDRPPFTRDNLRAKQPYYYNWLGSQFGVQK